VDAEIGYQNPHYFMAGSSPDLSDYIGPLDPQEISAETVSREIGKLMEFLDVVDVDIDLPETNVIQTPLLEYSNPFPPSLHRC
jgi:hypothetical protein